MDTDNGTPSEIILKTAISKGSWKEDEKGILPVSKFEVLQQVA